MPVNFSVKNVPDELAARLRARAAANHRSLQRELMAILTAAADSAPAAEAGWRARLPRPVAAGAQPRPTVEEVIARIMARRPAARARGSSAVAIIRRMRDARYGDARLDAPRPAPPAAKPRHRGR